MGEISSVYKCTLSLNSKTYVVSKILCYIKSFKIVKIISDNAIGSADIVQIVYIPCMLTVC
jgi:hypothetical protein